MRPNHVTENKIHEKIKRFSPSVNGVQLSRLLGDTFNGTNLRVFLLKDGAQPNSSADGLHVLPKPLSLSTLDNFCAVPGTSLWGPPAAQPVHASITVGPPGSPSRNFNIETWR